MVMTPDALLAFLEAHDIEATTYSHPPLRTVADAKALRGDTPGAHTKNLFLRDSRKNYFLVTVEQDTPVNLKALRSKIGARGNLSFGSPEALYEMLGVLPGAVTVLAAVNDKAHRVTVAVDEAVLKAPLLNCHPLTSEKTTALTPDALLRFLKLTGHEPLRLSFKDEAEVKV